MFHNHTAGQAVPEGRMLSSKVMAHGGASGVLPDTRARTVRASPAEHGSGQLALHAAYVRHKIGAAA